MHSSYSNTDSLGSFSFPKCTLKSTAGHQNNSHRHQNNSRQAEFPSWKGRTIVGAAAPVDGLPGRFRCARRARGS